MWFRAKFIPWEDILGNVEDLMAGFGGLESADKFKRNNVNLLVL